MTLEATVTKIEKLSTSCIAITMRVGEDFYFNAGQYVWFITSAGRRAYSIASSSQNKSEITILVRQNTPESDYLKSLLSITSGSIISLRGPCGSLRIPVEGTKSLYIAGGVGISPFLSITRSLRDSNLERDISLLHFCANPDESLYSNELSLYAEKSKIFQKSTFYGKISSNAIAPEFSSEKDVYVVGSKNFIDAVYRLIVSLHLPFKTLNFEENFPSAANLPLDLNDNSIFKKVVDQSANHVVITDPNGIVLYANKSAENLTGYTINEMKNQTPRLWGGLMDPSVYKVFWRTLKEEKKPYKGELRNIRKNGDEYDVFATVSPILDGKGDLIGFMGIEEDITNAKANSEELKKITELVIDKYSSTKK